MGLLFLLLKVFGWFILISVIVISFRVFRSWYQLQYYKKQGLKIYFSPLLGPLSLFLRKETPGMRMKDEFLIDFLKDKRARGAFAHNRFGASVPQVSLTDPEYVKEYVLNEDKFHRVPMIKELKSNSGFIFQDGPSALHKRTIFSEIFRYEELKKLTPLIVELTAKAYREFAKTHSLTTERYTAVNIDHLYSKVIKAVSRVILYGRYDQADDSLEIQIQDKSEEIAIKFIQLNSNPFMAIFPGFFSKFPFLMPKIAEFYKSIEEMKDLLSRYMKIRESQGCEGVCAFDKIIAHNRECKRTGNTVDFIDTEELYGTINLFIFAAEDTSQNMSKLNLCYMAEKPHLRKFLEDVAKDVFDSQGYTTADIIDAHEPLEQYFKEAMRLESPSYTTFARQAQSDVVLKDIKIRKGDFITFTHTAANFNESLYDKPMEFRLDRFSKENMKNQHKFQYFPFGFGKRICLGRNLGALTVKVFLTLFCKDFDFKKPADVEYVDMMNFVRYCKTPVIDVRLKQSFAAES